MKIYVASSWRNLLQPGIVHALRRCGHEVYDFRHPAPGNTGFAWSSIDPAWEQWDAKAYRAALQHPIAVDGYAYDIGALKACDACVLVLPSGRSASWEFGYAMGQGKRGAVVQFDVIAPELMYREAEIITTMGELFDAFGEPKDDESVENAKKKKTYMSAHALGV
ncbi:MAG: hypothetical protein UY96_C0003G0044 [Parcubacteria group bacterium GW2011_GWB1_56_8]|nr:MAG: hypothetical protein UY96_C0003G0044 [Parcubacteria group bacterium GW2011_GWB1_56_8]